MHVCKFFGLVTHLYMKEIVVNMNGIWFFIGNFVSSKKSVCHFPLGDVLEIGVQWSVEKKDIPSFERYMAQLKPYYLDYR